MSADRPDPEQFVDDRHDDADADPYGIVPDDFLRHYPSASTIAEALAMAERATGKTDPDEFSRCPDPECLSVRIRKKAGRRSIPNKRPEDYVCTSCGHHFDEPAPSREACRAGEQATLREVTRR